MWQRKQTIYFFLAALLILMTPFTPLLKASNRGNEGYAAEVIATVDEVALNHTGPLGPQENQSLIALAVLLYGTALMLLLLIFQFRNRPLQIKLSRSLSLVLALVQVSYSIIIYRALASLGHTSLTIEYGWNLPLPAISALLVWLGYRGVKADEALVRAADRIR